MLKECTRDGKRQVCLFALRLLPIRQPTVLSVGVAAAVAAWSRRKLIGCWLGHQALSKRKLNPTVLDLTCDSGHQHPWRHQPTIRVFPAFCAFPPPSGGVSTGMPGWAPATGPTDSSRQSATIWTAATAAHGVRPDIQPAPQACLGPAVSSMPRQLLSYTPPTSSPSATSRGDHWPPCAPSPPRRWLIWPRSGSCSIRFRATTKRTAMRAMVTAALPAHAG